MEGSSLVHCSQLKYVNYHLGCRYCLELFSFMDRLAILSAVVSSCIYFVIHLLADQHSHSHQTKKQQRQPLIEASLLVTKTITILATHTSMPSTPHPHAFHLQLPPHHRSESGLPYQTLHAQQKAQSIWKLVKYLEINVGLYCKQAGRVQDAGDIEDDDEGDDDFDGPKSMVSPSSNILPALPIPFSSHIDRRSSI